MICAENTVQGTALRRKLGLSVPIIILLAAIAAIRVPLHDLGIVPEGSFVAWLLVFVPLATWLTVVVWRRVPNPFLTLVVIGLAYGVMLAVGHQLLWEAVWDGNSPSLGGNFEGVLALAWRRSSFAPPPSSAASSPALSWARSSGSWPGRSSARRLNRRKDDT